MNPFTLSDYEAAMTPMRLRVTQVIALGMAVAPLAYLGVGLFWTHRAPAGAEPVMAVVPQTLLLLALVAWMASGWVAEQTLVQRDLRKILEQGLSMPDGSVVRDRDEIVAVMLRGYVIMRHALYELSAMLGLVVAILQGHLLWTEKIWMLALAPCLLVPAIILLTFPTRDRLRALFEQTLLNRPLAK